MASEEESTSDSVSVRQIPKHLLKYLRSRIQHYVAEESKFSAEIHQDAEQPARLVFSMGSKPQSKLPMEEQNTNEENGSTNVILVQNFPSMLDEEILELFFESTKKKGGGPVRNVKLNRSKNWALVEFVEPEGVQTVLSKRPITILDTTLDIQPYSPLIQGGEQMKSVEVRGLPKDLTEDLQAMYLESIIDPSAVSDTLDRADVSMSKVANKHSLSTVESLGPVNTSASTSVSIKQVPSNLQNYLRSRVLHYFAEVNDFVAEIQQISGQPSQLILLVGHKATGLQSGMLNVGDSTNKILVQNIPSPLDEDMIEIFFESTKKCGGGPVNKLKLDKEKHLAIVEFADPKAVKTVMNKTPIKILDATVDIRPYAPLLKADEPIESLTIKGLPIELTGDIITAQLDDVTKTNSVVADEVNVMGKVTETVHSTDHLKLRMLGEAFFQKDLSERFPNIRFRINLNRNEVIFDRCEATFRSAKMHVFEMLDKTSVRVLENISQNCLDLFQFKQTMDYITDRLETEKKVCGWEVRASQLAVCSFTEDISSCVDIIIGSVKEKQIPVPTLAFSFSIQSTPWQDMVAAVQCKSKGLCKVGLSEDSSVIYVTATDNVMQKIFEKIQTYLKRYTMVRKSFLVWSCDLKILDQFVNELSHHSVEILESRVRQQMQAFPLSILKQHEVKVAGTTDALNLLEERLNHVK